MEHFQPSVASRAHGKTTRRVQRLVVASGDAPTDVPSLHPGNKGASTPRLRFRLEGLGEVEGTPSEIRALIEELQRGGLLRQQHQTTFTPPPAPQERPSEGGPNHETAPHASPKEGEAREEGPTDLKLLMDYEADIGLSKDTRRAYVRVVHDFKKFLSTKRLTLANKEDVRAYVRACSQVCRFRMSTSLIGKNRGSLLRYACMKNKFGWTTTPPAECAAGKCGLWQAQRSGPLARLRALKHFYEYLEEADHVEANPVGLVQKRTRRSIGPGKAGRKKYAPSIQDARDLLRATRIVGTPWHVAVLLCLLKWGRRPGHLVLLQAEDLRDLDAPRGAHASFERVREEVLARNLSGSSKLKDNLLSVIDDELREFLVQEYLPYRAEYWGLPRREGRLFPARWADRMLLDEDIQDQILEPAMRWLEEHAETERERSKWRAHRTAGHRERISPGCFRHFFTTTLKRFGVEDGDIDILRGDLTRGSKGHYLDLRAEDLHAMYRMPSLLRADAGSDRVDA